MRRRRVLGRDGSAAPRLSNCRIAISISTRPERQGRARRPSTRSVAAAVAVARVGRRFATELERIAQSARADGSAPVGSSARVPFRVTRGAVSERETAASDPACSSSRTAGPAQSGGGGPKEDRPGRGSPQRFTPDSERADRHPRREVRRSVARAHALTRRKNPRLRRRGGAPASSRRPS